MSMSINSNIGSISARRHLGKSQNKIAEAMKRLSSGLRINSAKDDAAGLQITDRMTAQIVGLNQAVRNTNDGISLVQTTEGALQEISNIIQRIRELSVQAANDSNSAIDRRSIQKEINQLNQEINRIAEKTEFNGQNLLDGTFSDKKIQVGAESGQSLALPGLADFRSTRVPPVEKKMVNDNPTATPSTSPLSSMTLEDLAQFLAGPGVTISNVTLTGSSQGAGIFNGGVSAGIGIETGVILSTGDASEWVGPNDSPGNTTSLGTSGDSDLTELSGQNTYDATILEFDILPEYTETTFKFAFASEEYLEYVNSINDVIGFFVDGENIAKVPGTDTQISIDSINNTENSFLFIDNTGGGSNTQFDGFSVPLTAFLRVEPGKTHHVKLAIADAADSVLDSAVFIQKASFSSGLTLSDISVDSNWDARSGISVCDAALDYVNDARSQLGAYQNRLESTTANLHNISQNLSAARSRILDADIAQESSVMIKNNILQQAGTSLLTQTNMAPQMALQLIQ